MVQEPGENEGVGGGCQSRDKSSLLSVWEGHEWLLVSGTVDGACLALLAYHQTEPQRGTCLGRSLAGDAHVPGGSLMLKEQLESLGIGENRVYGEKKEPSTCSLEEIVYGIC